MQDGKPLTTRTEYRELVLMEMPEELAQERNEYFAEITRRQTVGLKERAQEDLNEQARSSGAKPQRLKGSIVID